MVALEPHHHRHGMARWRRCLMCVVCMAGEVEELKSHLLVVYWKMEVASLSWEWCGLCWVSVGGASLGCGKRLRKVVSEQG